MGILRLFFNIPPDILCVASLFSHTVSSAQRFLIHVTKEGRTWYFQRVFEGVNTTCHVHVLGRDGCVAAVVSGSWWHDRWWWRFKVGLLKWTMPHTAADGNNFLSLARRHPHRHFQLYLGIVHFDLRWPAGVLSCLRKFCRKDNVGGLIL